METCLKVLLIVGAVTAAPAPSSSPLPSHEDAVLAAVQIYNQDPDITLAYRLLEAEPQPDWVSDLGNRFVACVYSMPLELIEQVNGKSLASDARLLYLQSGICTLAVISQG